MLLLLLIIISIILTRARRPWDRQAWGDVRKAADDVLCRGKVAIQHEKNQADYFTDCHFWFSCL